MDKSKNRYADVPRNPDWTIEQSWNSYTAEEHDRWDRLFKCQQEVLATRACPPFLKAVEKLQLSESGIPDMERLSDRLEKISGWRVVPVTDLVPDDVFFEHLANRRFPAGAFIRPEEEFDYLEEPDIFHDIFGHVPLLAVPAYAEFMQAYGKGGMRAMQLDQLQNLARLYWYTIEFGLFRSDEGLRIFGAGILSSPHESVFSLEDKSPNRVAFDIERIMRTEVIIDDFQQTYFVIDSFEQLLEDCYEDFADVYRRVKSKADISAHALLDTDDVLSRGTLEYFKARHAHAS